jgi:hypothetical protein
MRQRLVLTTSWWRSAMQPDFPALCSGYGVHAYWPLLDVLDAETWKTYSVGLAALLRKHGIKHERTTDIASLLRPPGTHNRKREPRIVGVLP